MTQNTLSKAVAKIEEIVGNQKQTGVQLESVNSLSREEVKPDVTYFKAEISLLIRIPAQTSED